MQPKETAKLIRKELKQQFPKVKFSVRTSTYSMGASIDIRWTDFPTEKLVMKAIEKYERVRRCEITGEILSGGNLYISCSNEWSDQIKEGIEKEMPDDVGPDHEHYYYWFLRTADEVYIKHFKVEIEQEQKPNANSGKKKSSKRSRSYQKESDQSEKTSKDRKKQADKLRKSANTLTKQIQEKRAPRLTNTPRRLEMALSIQRQADQLERLQKILYSLADSIESGTVKLLQCIRSRTEIQTLISIVERAKFQKDEDRTYYSDLYHDIRKRKFTDSDFSFLQLPRLNSEDHKRLKRMKIEDENSLLAIIREFVPHYNVARKSKEEELKEKIEYRVAKAAQSQIPDYFPTPQKIIDQMLGHLNITPDMKVLEPSAGCGHIADQLRNKSNHVDVIEMNPELREILQDKNHHVVASDFLHFSSKTYDVIVMNPPFSKGQDIEHVQHAYQLLNAGGMLVALMSEGPFFRKDQKSINWRSFLQQIDGTVKRLEEGSFLQSDRKTGVSVRMVILKKSVEPLDPMEFHPYHIKKQQRLERYQQLTEKHQEQAYQRFNSRNSKQLIDMAGEPVKIGHHSERRHRNLIKRADKDMFLGVEHTRKAEHFQRKMKSLQNNQSIHSDDPEAIQKLRKKLEKMKEFHRSMKFINQEYKRCKGDIDQMQVSDKIKQQLKRAKQDCPSESFKPIPSWQLQNNNARIKNTQKRLEELEKLANQETINETYGSIQIIDNADINRIQISFPGKPSLEIRKKLKQRGFRWAPSQKAWQRHRSNEAFHYARQIVMEISEEEKSQ